MGQEELLMDYEIWFAGTRKYHSRLLMFQIWENELVLCSSCSALKKKNSHRTLSDKDKSQVSSLAALNAWGSIWDLSEISGTKRVLPISCNNGSVLSGIIWSSTTEQRLFSWHKCAFKTIQTTCKTQTVQQIIYFCSFWVFFFLLCTLIDSITNLWTDVTSI